MTPFEELANGLLKDWVYYMPFFLCNIGVKMAKGYRIIEEVKMKSRRLLLTVAGVLFAVFSLAACSGLQSNKKSSSSKQPESYKSEKKKTQYMDFGDVMLPSMLSIDNDRSFVLSASGLTAGVLSLKGRVEVNSLLKFFENRMPADGWTLENKFRSLRSMLLFTKQNRNCVITIDEGRFNTMVEIWVAPSVQGAVSGLHK